MVFRGMGGLGSLAGLGLLVAVAGLASVAVVSRGGSAGPPAQEGPSLADRVNAACAPFELVDWTTGDEWDHLAPGTVQVTCSRGDGTLFYVAVGR